MGAKGAPFRHFHIGGCSSCAFHAEETLKELCERNDRIHPPGSHRSHQTEPR